MTNSDLSNQAREAGREPPVIEKISLRPPILEIGAGALSKKEQTEKNIDVNEVNKTKRNEQKIVFTSSSQSKDSIAIPLSEIPAEDSPHWETRKVEISIPLVRRIPEAEEDWDITLDSSLKHFILAPEIVDLEDTRPSYVYALFSRKQLQDVNVEYSKLGTKIEDMKIGLSIYAVENEEYELCDEVQSFFTKNCRCCHVEIQISKLMNKSDKDVAGLLLFVEMSPKNVYLVRPEFEELIETNKTLMDIACDICFTFPRNESIEIFDFYNSDEETSDEDWEQFSEQLGNSETSGREELTSR